MSFMKDAILPRLDKFLGLVTKLVTAQESVAKSLDEAHTQEVAERVHELLQEEEDGTVQVYH